MVDLYYSAASAPCRSVQMLAKALGLQLNLKKLDIPAKEHLQLEYLRLNPQHVIPTMVDGDFVLWESRAILLYLVEKYGKDDSLYPKDHQQRAVVNQRLYFDIGTLNHGLTEYYYAQMMYGKPAYPEKFKQLVEAVEFFDGFLAKTIYAACDKPTIADYALVATVSTLDVSEFDLSPYKNVTRWYELCKTDLAGIEANADGLVAMQYYVDIMKQRVSQ